MAHQADLARVGHDESGALPYRLLDIKADNGVGFSGVGTDAKKAGGLA